MGEIGIPRREFLYEIHFWEVRRIIRGYRRRDRLKHQLIAECAYAAIYAMRDPQGKTVADVFPSIFADEEEDADNTYDDPDITEGEVDDLIDLMDSFNSENNKQSTAP